MADIFVPSFLDGFHVAPSIFDAEPSETCYEEFRRQLLKNCEKSNLPLITEPSGRQLSYAHLDKMVHRLVCVLRRHDIGQKPVAVFLPPGCSRIAALLALNHLGAPFVPIDTVQTNSQRAYILEHSQSQAVILDKNRTSLFDSSDKVRAIVIDQDCSDGEHSNDSIRCCQTDSKNDGERVSLILYTSGSTGVPKGVMLTDANLFNRLRWQWAELPFSDDRSEACLAKTNHLFVDSYTEILGSTLRLQRLVIVDPNAWKKAESANVAALMADAIEKHKVTRLILVPSLLRALLELPDASKRLASLRFVVSSGEFLPPELAQRFFRTLASSPSQPRLANFYGSTEVTGDVTAAVFASEADVAARTIDGVLSVGRPLHNTTIYILKEETLQPVGLGEIGYVFVSGANVCKGFTGQSHMFDPFREKHSDLANIGTGQRMFSMGDLGRIVPGGELFYCGRSDSIVKIRGNRLSTVQVEDALKEVLRLAFEKNPPQSGQAPRCRVLAVDHLESGTSRLVGFYEQWPEASLCLRPDNVRKELASRLQHYAVPELLFPLEAGTFPFQPHTGKTDQRALKQMAQEAFMKAVEDAKTALAGLKPNNGDLESALEAVRRVSAHTLGIPVDKIVMDATFANQGANSLSVIAAVTAFNKIGYKDATADILLAPDKTLSDVARHLSESFQKNFIESCRTFASSFSMPDWLEFRNVADLTEAEHERTRSRLDYSFTVIEPLARFVDIRPRGLLRVFTADWPYYIRSGPLSFVAFDRRRPGLDAIVGCCNCLDFTDETDVSAWVGCEVVLYVLIAAEKPVHDELLKQLSVDHLPPGLVLSQRVMYVEDDYPSDDAAIVFFAMEKALLERGRKAGFKMVMSENTNLATQRIEQELLGYTERFALYLHDFEVPDGTRPYAHVPKDYAVRTVTREL